MLNANLFHLFGAHFAGNVLKGFGRGRAILGLESRESKNKKGAKAGVSDDGRVTFLFLRFQPCVTHVMDLLHGNVGLGGEAKVLGVGVDDDENLAKQKDGSN